MVTRGTLDKGDQEKGREPENCSLRITVFRHEGTHFREFKDQNSFTASYRDQIMTGRFYRTAIIYIIFYHLYSPLTFYPHQYIEPTLK